MPNAVCVVILMVSLGMGVTGTMPATQSWKGWPRRNWILCLLVRSSLLRSVPLKEKAEAMGLTSVLDMERLQLQLGKWDG